MYLFIYLRQGPVLLPDSPVNPEVSVLPPCCSKLLSSFWYAYHIFLFLYREIMLAQNLTVSVPKVRKINAFSGIKKFDTYFLSKRKWVCSNRMDASSLGIRNCETVRQRHKWNRQVLLGSRELWKQDRRQNNRGRHGSGLLQERDEHSEWDEKWRHALFPCLENSIFIICQYF